MNIARIPRWIPITIAFFGILYGPILFPSLPIHYTAPLLVVLCYQLPLTRCLWWGFGCGLLLDLLSDTSHIGLFATSYTFSTFVLYRLKHYFFADHLSTLPLMTALFSSISTISLLILFRLFEKGFVFHWSFLFTDVLFMPLLDGFFAFTLFILPSLAFGKRMRKGEDYFMKRKKKA